MRPLECCSATGRHGDNTCFPCLIQVSLLNRNLKIVVVLCVIIQVLIHATRPHLATRGSRCYGCFCAKDGSHARLHSRDIPEVPQRETSEAFSATNSEIDSAINHRRRKTSLRNSIFPSQEFKALNSVDTYLGAVRSSFENAVDDFSKGLQVKSLFLITFTISYT